MECYCLVTLADL